MSATSPQIGFRALNGFYGEGDGPVFNVTCTAFDNGLDECTISNQTTCSHSQDGGAICAGIYTSKLVAIWVYQ